MSKYLMAVVVVIFYLTMSGSAVAAGTSDKTKQLGIQPPKAVVDTAPNKPNTPPKGTITITTPQSGATLFSTTTISCAWSCVGSCNPVDVTLWKDNLKIVVIAENNSSERITSYKLPILNAGDYELRVTSKYDPRLEAKQKVKIVIPSISISAPPSGATINSPTDNLHIKWECAGTCTPVDVTLWRENKKFVSFTTNYSQYELTNAKLPILASGDYELRVAGQQDPRIEAKQKVKIVIPSISITAPPSGATINSPTDNLHIKWECVGPCNPVNVSLWRENMKVVGLISNYSQNELTNAKLPALATGDYELRVTSQNDTRIEGKEPVHVNSPPPTLTKAEIVFLTTGENKDWDTALSVWVKDKSTDKRLITFAPSYGTEYKPGSSNTVSLMIPANSNLIPDDFRNMQASISVAANGNDRWSFKSRLILSFSDGTSISRDFPNEHIVCNRAVFDLDASAGRIGCGSASSGQSTSCTGGIPIAGYSFVGQPGCATSNRADHPTASLACDSTGYYCCENAQGAHSPRCGTDRHEFPPDCMSYCTGVTNCFVQLINGYGCYKPNN